MKKEQIEQMQRRQAYPNVWHVELMPSMSTAPGYCCFALWCPCCASYQLRRRALYGDMSRYVCCGGYMPCSGKLKEKKCPEACLVTEVSLCFVQSVMSTRWMLQDEFQLQTTKCDNCLVGTMFVIQQIACICTLLACITGSDELKDLAECLRCIADVVTCTVTTWMMTQQKIEMDKRDGLIEPNPPMGAPPMQQMSRNDRPNPPPADGYPAQPVPYGYPQPGVPPPVYAPGHHPAFPPHGFAPGPYPPNPGLPPPIYDSEPHHHARHPGHPPPLFDPEYHRGMPHSSPSAPSFYPDPHRSPYQVGPPPPGYELEHRPPGPPSVFTPGNPPAPQKMV